MERCDFLYPGGPCFFYDDSRFAPGTDSFLLGDFIRAKRGDTVCDLGAGTGLIGLLLFARQPKMTLHTVELQEASLAYAVKTLAPYPVTHHLLDLRHIRGSLPLGAFDLVVTNPPYFSEGSGLSSKKETLQLARSESGCTLEDVITAAARLLRWGGRFGIVYKPERLVELFCLMRQQRLEPKRLRHVQHNAAAAPSLVLVEGRRGGNPGLTLERPLILHHMDGSDTEETDRIYFREEP